jgi:hypothetical protein
MKANGSPSPHYLSLDAPTLAAALQFTALADIARLLDGPDEALASGVRHIYRDRPMPGLTAALGPGSTGEDAARLIGSLLLSVPEASFTMIMHALTRERPRIQPLPGEEGRVMPLSEADEVLGQEPGTVAGALGLPPATTGDGWGRKGKVIAGTTICADTFIYLLPDLVPAGPMGQIKRGAPAGTALEGWDMRRIEPAVRLTWPHDPGLCCTAVVCLGAKRVGVAAQQVTAGLLDRLAKSVTEPG